MKRTSLLSQRLIPLSVVAVVVLTASTGRTADIPDKTDPAKVVGAESCTKCHKSELAALDASRHHGSLTKMGEGNAAKFIAAVGGKKDMCIKCHATPKGDRAIQAVSGVSCESCHGGAADWLEIHGKEGVAQADRHAGADEGGMIRSSNVYTIAKNCFNCHVVFNEKLVNEGHPASNKIEFLGWSTGEMRHNFQKDQKNNADAPSAWAEYASGKTQDRRRLKLVVGHLVDLEVCLTNLGKVTNGKGDFAKGNSKRAKAALGEVEDIADDLDDAAPPELNAAIKAAKALGRFSSISVKAKQIKAAPAAAASVAKAAAAISGKYDGSTFGDIDGMVGKAKPKGTPYSP